MNWENKVSSQGIHYSRYIASYNNELKKLLGRRISWGYRGGFITWLKSTGLSEDEAREVANLAENGKLELETSAMAFIKGVMNKKEES